MSQNHQSTVIETEAASIHLTQRGTLSPALLFLHYWGGSARTWNEVIDRIDPTIRCIAIDHRGWGQSSSPDHGYGISDMAADTLAVIDALELDDYILVGHSMGGKVAQLIATGRPSGLRGLILVAPAPARPLDIPVDVRDQMAHAYDSEASVTATLDSVLSHAPISAKLRRQVIEDSLAGSPEARRQWPVNTILEDVSAHIDRIAVPVRVVVGRQDQVERVEVMESHVVSLIPGSTLNVIDDCGHLVPLERPNELADQVLRFWRSQREGP